MEYKNAVLDLIKVRVSTRTFDSKKLDEQTITIINDYLEELTKTANIKARFVFVSMLLQNSNDANIINSSKSVEPVKLGTYGMITGAHSFIIGLIDKEEKDFLRFGYSFEKIILFATDLGLGTCWLGGTFDRDGFNKQIDIKENESIAIVTPIGYKKEKMRFTETIIRKVVKADKRKSWNELFFDNNSSTSLVENKSDKEHIALEMIRLGPSASNKQPWRAIKSDKGFDFYIARTPGYGGAMTYDMQKNDIGIAMCHFELSLNEMGIQGAWKFDSKNTNAANDWEYMISWKSNVLD